MKEQMKCNSSTHGRENLTELNSWWRLFPSAQTRSMAKVERFIEWARILTLNWRVCLLSCFCSSVLPCSPRLMCLGCHIVPLWGAQRHFDSMESFESRWLTCISMLTLVYKLLPWIISHLRAGIGCNSALDLHSVCFKKMLQNWFEHSRDSYLSSGMFDRPSKFSTFTHSWFSYIDFMTM